VEFLAVIVMIAAGIAVAIFVLVAFTLAKRTEAHERREGTAPDRDRVAASLLHHILTLGGATTNEALRAVRRGTGLAAQVTPGIDVGTWAERFAQMATQAQCAWLLDAAVQLSVAQAKTISLPQYTALLDLSFALGFQTDALARLRERYQFDYVDPARAGRPRDADRGGVLFVRERFERSELLHTLGLEGEPSRQEIIRAYRRLVAEVHPDRVHDQPERVRTEAAARFIEITRAYETLMERVDG
jgi:DnaJ-domain-containing protein 1